jgi:hypothetical protein
LPHGRTPAVPPAPALCAQEPAPRACMRRPGCDEAAGRGTDGLDHETVSGPG